MAYDIDVVGVEDAIGALPRSGQLALAEVMALLERTPWAGDPLVGSKPTSALRTLPFGEGGLLTYLIVEDVGRVDLLAVQWAR